MLSETNRSIAEPETCSPTSGFLTLTNAWQGFASLCPKSAGERPEALAGRCSHGAGSNTAQGVRAYSLQVGGLLRRTFHEPVDGPQPGCRDRDSTKAPLAEDWSDQRRRSLIKLPMAHKPKVTRRRPKTFEAARRRALARLRNGIDLQWTRSSRRHALRWPRGFDLQAGEQFRPWRILMSRLMS